jgi:hypothetical protein
MRLLDRVSQLAPRGLVEFDDRFVAVPRVEELRTSVPRCPLRYVLATDVSDFCLRTVADNAAFLHETADIVGAPAPAFWVEWNASPCQKRLQELGVVEPGVVRFERDRAGLYVECDARGRRGRISVCSGSPDDQESVEIAPFEIQFDFDNPNLRETAAREDDSIGVATPRSPGLSKLLGFVIFRLYSPWSERLESIKSPERFRATCMPAMWRTVMDFPMLWAFLALLNARNAVTVAAADLERLNVARARRGRRPLLSHLEVRSVIASTARGAGGIGEERAQPRLHLVRGHLVRRRDKVFWRTGHMRGHADRGTIETRTVTVELGERASSAPPSDR